MLLAAFAAAISGKQGSFRVSLLAIILLFILLKNRKVFLNYARIRFWIFPLLFFCLGPFLIGKPETSVFGVPYSLEQLRTGMVFLLNVFVFASLAAFISGFYSMKEIVAVFESMGIRSFGLRTALAMSAVSMLKYTVLEMWLTYRALKPSLQESIIGFPVFFGAVLRNSARMAENISILFFIRNVKL